EGTATRAATAEPAPPGESEAGLRGGRQRDRESLPDQGCAVGVRAGDTGGGRFVIASRDTPAVRVGKANGELRVQRLVRTVRLCRRTRCDPDEHDRQGRNRQPASHPLWRTVIGPYHCKS